MIVDIVIPSYRPRFFEQALRSAISQTYDNVRIYVSDNCPTDEIEKICRKYSSFNLVYRRSQILSVGNYISAFKMGDGEFIKPLFDDDVLHPFCVERLIRGFLEETPAEVGLAFSASAVISVLNEQKSIRSPIKEKAFLAPGFFKTQGLSQFFNYIGEPSTVLFKRQHLDRFISDSGFSWRGVDCNHAIPDVSFFLRIDDIFSAYYTPEILSYFRKDSSHVSDSSNYNNPDYYKIFTTWFDLYENLHDFEINTSYIPRVVQFVQDTERLFMDNPLVIDRCTAFRNFLENSHPRERSVATMR